MFDLCAIATCHFIVLLLLLQLWAFGQRYSSMAPRVELVAGDMFDPDSVPAPPAGSSGQVAYILRNVLHDW